MLLLQHAATSAYTAAAAIYFARVTPHLGNYCQTQRPKQLNVFFTPYKVRQLITFIKSINATLHNS